MVDVRATVSLADGRQVDCRTRDVSRTGICLIMNGPLPAGEILRLDLVLAFSEDAFSEPLVLPARVVWCTGIAQSYQVGAMFEEVSEEQDGYLDMFLQFLDGTLSHRSEAATGGGAEDDEEGDRGAVDPDEVDDPFKS
jgi:hypothetical protein